MGEKIIFNDRKNKIYKGKKMQTKILLKMKNYKPQQKASPMKQIMSKTQVDHTPVEGHASKNIRTTQTELDGLKKEREDTRLGRQGRG